MKSIYFSLFFIALFIISCSKASQLVDSIPTYETFTIQSKQVNEARIINVWTPDNYKTSTDSLPVMYMADGGIKEDFPHITNTLAELIKQNKIKPIILVGIENTQRRKDLSGFTTVEKDKKIALEVGGSEQFRAFIKDELFAEINKKYRTSNRKGIIGESLSGLFVTETFLLTPEMFDFYIAFDPSLWWNNQYLVKTAKKHLVQFPNEQKIFWFAGSNAEDISPSTKQLRDVLKAENSSNIKWNYSDEPNEEHSTIFRATKEKAIVWTLNQ